MPNQVDDTSQHLSRKESIDHPLSPETEIAYILQNSQPGDRKLIDLLVETYAKDIEWLFEILTFNYFQKRSSFEDIVHLVGETFLYAINHCDQFWGEASVRNWLFSLAIRIKRSQSNKAKLHFKREREVGEAPSKVIHLRLESTTSWQYIKKISEKQYLALVFHSVKGFPISDIADILGVSVTKVHEWFTNIRLKLLKGEIDQISPPESASHRGEAHKINRSRIQARLDGLVEANSMEAISLREHLSACQTCNAYADACESHWKQLKDDLNDKLPRDENPEFSFVQLKQHISERLGESPRRKHTTSSLRKAVWISLLLMIFASGTWALMRVTPEQGEFPPTPTPTERFLPEPISPGQAPPINEQGQEGQMLAAYALEPKISADGRWIAYTSNVGVSGNFGSEIRWEIMLYDTQARTLESISTRGTPMEGILLVSLDISADGRWIVFNAVADAIETNDEPCRSETSLQCIDIFLYDRINRRITRITHGYDGSFANGFSMSPSISDNGRWILFWSAANNLVDEDEETCEVNGKKSPCIDLYIYDRNSEGVERLAFGRGISEEEWTFPFYYPSADISNDGRWLLLTLFGSDRIVDEVGLQAESDVYIYDREEKVLEPVDVAVDGSQGNGISAFAQMTPDGRYISFYSTSDNLVAEDENGFGDVFLLDREDGEIKLISSASDGTQANNDSGIDIGIGGEIAISNDANFITYSSLATNLDPESDSYCLPSDENPCISIYVYDDTTHYTKRLEIPQVDHFPLMPDLSGDGSLISYIDVENSCSNTGDTCVDLKLYDREREWTSEITRNLFPRTELPWVRDKILQTPPIVSDLEFSPDGVSIALAGTGPQIEILSASDGEQLQTLKGTKKSSAYVRLVAYSPDGEYIAGGSTDGTVNVWRTTDGSLAFVLDNHPGRIVDLQFSAEGDFLYVATPRTVWGWHLAERKFTREFTLEYPIGFIKDIDISPSNELLTVAPTKEPYVWIQRLPGGEVIHRLSGYGRNVSSVFFSPDGDRLIAQYQDGQTQVWSLEVDALGTSMPKFINVDEFPPPLGRVVFSPDGNYVSVGSTYGGLWIWDIANDRKQFVSASFETSAVSDVDFSVSSKMLAAATHDGIYLWKNKFADEAMAFFTHLATDEFIQIPNRRRPLREARADVGLDRLGIDGLTYYQVEEQTSLDVYAPLRLPSNIAYVKTAVKGDGSVLTAYRVDDVLTGEPLADLYFLQQANTENYRPFWLGASGIVEQVEFNDRLAEYVKGDWLRLFSQNSSGGLKQASQDLYWAWSSESEVQQLRWRNLNQVFSLIYLPGENIDPAGQSISAGEGDGKLHQPIITKYDLIGIASGVSKLPASSSSDPILINYTVKLGDTCTSIAGQYGTTIGELIRLNKLSDNCDVILAGQTLRVNLPKERRTFAESDLNCDGQLERIRFIPVPEFPGVDITYGFVQEALSDIGVYDTVWQYTITDLGREYLTHPQLLTVNGCQQLLAVNQLPLSAGSETVLNALKIFSWDGESMNVAFTADGRLQSVTTSEEGVVTLTTLKLEYLPGTSECNRINVTYSWDGDKFIETSRSMEENTSCTVR